MGFALSRNTQFESLKPDTEEESSANPIQELKVIIYDLKEGQENLVEIASFLDLKGLKRLGNPMTSNTTLVTFQSRKPSPLEHRWMFLQTWPFIPRPKV